MFGLTVEEASGDDVLVWPDNLPALNVLIAMGTQWRTAGMAGMPAGLDYSAITPLHLHACDVSEEAWAAHVFADLRIAEGAALEQMAENRKSAA